MAPSNQQRLNRRLNAYVPSSPTDHTKGFVSDLFKVLPKGGQQNLVENIFSLDDDGLRQHMQHIHDAMLVPLRAAGGKTPTEITLSPRYGEDLKSLDIDPISRNSQSQLRAHCLERDGGKCLATGVYEPKFTPLPPNAIAVPTNASHIIPFAMGIFNRQNTPEVHRHSEIWTTIGRYFPKLHRTMFTSEQINTEQNIMTLDSQIHGAFGAFQFAFMATRVRHEYRLELFDDMPSGLAVRLPESRMVRFEVHKGDWQLPNPDFLAMHAAIAKFFHMQGHGERIDKLLDRYQECGGLAPSGSTNVEALLSVSGLSLMSSNVAKEPEKEGKKKIDNPSMVGRGALQEN
ncbi:hypothetical protein N7456_007426 [Penicillium angulare]|uniref:HNH nuclease domain-containing protein n=1 Tax=Penicillium angulare TaxID=116970 RepID=A0A9W9K8E4_9EURO|nr:hypothetical protein N7456_007426 [Penicillium angulare]